MKKIFLLLLLSLTLFGVDTKLRSQIGQMLIIGFEGSELNASAPIIKEIQKYDLGGVILFDKNLQHPKKTKNIINPHQLQQLTRTLRAYSRWPLFIAVDQEGGRVARLKSQYGFYQAPSALEVAQSNYPYEIYEKQATMLHNNGINMNFAPVLDLAKNPKNKVIVQLERSYGNNPQKVIKYASIMIDEQTKHSIISVAKHFPGHGSSLGDSHKGFVDVTQTWSKEELIPYTELIKRKKLDAVMVAHVFNRHLDPLYPATLSKKTIDALLRKKLHFSGLVVSDDMQMKAITKHYTLKEALTKAINAGVDMLIFGNQLAHTDTKTIIDTIYKQVKSGAIPRQRIQEANKRINMLHFKNSIIHKPILFAKERIKLTKEYIKKHYAKEVEDITIQPKMIVLHWTAENDFKKSYNRLYPQKLYSDRKDIADASALNVSAHFLVARDGTVYQLMPENIMARHVIGLNYSAIGIENVGGKNNKEEDLTPAQLKSNIRLVRYLKNRYPGIEYLIGHYEYTNFQNTPLWLEKDKNYRTHKVDPGKKFMKNVRRAVRNLHLKSSYAQ